MKSNEEQKLPRLNINWFPGHMAKTRREIENDLKLIDVVVELLDARIPISSRNPDIQRMTKGKRKIIVLNKCDLADDEITKKWQQELSKEAPVILTEASSGRGVDKIIKKVDSLMQEEIERQKARGRVNKTIRIMILGIPNVGKSSLINRLAKSAKLEVGNKPGVTKAKQWIRISKNQELLDTPGVLWPKFQTNEIGLNLSFTGTIKDDILETTEIAYELLKVLYRNYKNKLVERYKLTDEELKNADSSSNTIYSLMQIIARKRGALVSGGEIDEERIARIIIEDFRSSKLGKISLEQPK